MFFYVRGLHIMEMKDNENAQDDMILIDEKCDLVLSDQKEALDALAMDKDFVDKLICQKTLKGMQQLFSNRGVILSEEEIDDFIEMVKASVSKNRLSDEFLETISVGAAVEHSPLPYCGLLYSIGNLVNGKKENPAYIDSAMWI